MKYLKKYPLFFTIVSLLCLVFVAGAVYDVYLESVRLKSSAKLDSSMRAYSKALSEDPTQKAIDASDANIKKLEGRLGFLVKDLTRAGADIFKPLTAKEGYQLVEQLRGMVNKWRRDAKNLGIFVPDDMDFSFKKYVAPNSVPPRVEAIPAIWKQACVLDYIMKKLYMCKSEESPMVILWVQREVLKEEGVKSTTGRKNVVTRRRKSQSVGGDNFEIDKAITARKEGSLNTLAYRFVFAGHTDVLRRFLNQLKDFDAMLVVRSIDVRPADNSALSVLMSPTVDEGGEDMETSSDAAASALFGGENADGGNASGTGDGSGGDAASGDGSGAAAADGGVTVENRTPVVTDNISEFTVVIEYVDVVMDSDKPAAEDKEGAAKEDDASKDNSKNAK